MKKTIIRIAAVALALSPLGIALPAFADTVNVNFESPLYSLGSIGGQDGWSNAVNPAYDQGVTTTPATFSSTFGSQSFRISDAVTSGSFGDWVFAKPLTNAVGETSATDGAFTPGTLQQHFETEFDIASILPESQQSGLHVSVSPDRGDGSRMSYLRFEDGASGINVFFDDVTSSGTPGSDQFRETEIATGLNRAIPHHVKLTMDTLDGPSNDVVQVYLDGVLVHTGNSWEDYYRYDSEASPELTPRIVKTVIIQARGDGTTPADLGNGFLFDNLSLSSGPIPTPTPSTVKVTIDKFIDGHMATATTSNSQAFPMSATWSATNIGSGSGTFALSTTGFNSPNPYEAVTADMTTGANYSASEATTVGTVVANDCSTGAAYKLAGYTSGDTLAAAEAASSSPTAPSFTNLTSDKFIIVWNKPCLATPVNLTPADGSTLTTAAFIKADWTDVTDPFGPITYVYEASNASTTNPDGSFTSPVYTSGVLATSEIPTAGTPAGVYYWHAHAVDADGNLSPWSAPFKITVDNTPPAPPLKVHVLKYLNGAEATALSAGGYLFPMTATWNTANLNGGATTTGSYVLGNNYGGASSLYGADTAPMAAPANYSTAEVTDTSSQVVSDPSLCAPGKFLLTGYQVSAVSFADAATHAPSAIAPAFTGLTSDEYVIVDNATCPRTGSLTVEKDTIGGNSTFTLVGDNGIGSFTLTTVGSTTGGTASQTFTNLAPGTYHVTEAAKSGWTLTDNECSTVVVTAGGAPVCIITNTNNRLLGEIRGTKYEDRDGDGKLADGDHHRLAGWTIYLDTNNNGVLDSGEPTDVTDSHGNYDFPGLAVGTYHVREVGQSGWTQTYPSSGAYTVTLSAGQIAKNKSFGNFHYGSISGMKFNDLNGNHKKDANEPGLAGWTIVLRGPNHVTQTAVTDANGAYSFTNLLAGNYMLTEVQQNGWKQTLHPGTVHVTSGTNATNKNFGNKTVTRRDNHDNNHEDDNFTD